MTTGSYTGDPCSNCGRIRVELDGICDKCHWDTTKDDYADQCNNCEHRTNNEDGYCSDLCREMNE